MQLFPADSVFPSSSLFPGEQPATGFQFTPPFVVRSFVIDGALRGQLQYGVTVMQIDGQWVEAEFPTWEQESNASLFFRGGHIATVDASTAADLIDAGYEVVEITT